MDSTTPVVKLVQKHQEAIEKHQEEIRNSMSSPDILKGRMDSFRKSRVVENNESAKTEEMCTTFTKTDESFKKESSNNEETVVTTKQTASNVVSESISESTSTVQKSEMQIQESICNVKYILNATSDMICVEI